jgi:hypothetical protein
MIASQERNDGRDATLLARVRASVERKHELLVRLDELSRRQMTLLDEDQAERLLDLLSERQHVIDQLQRASAALEPLRTAWNAAAAGLPDGEQEPIRRGLEAIAALMDQIGTRDDDARRRLSRRRDEIGIELAGIGRGRGALAAYARAAGVPPPSFQDREA